MAEVKLSSDRPDSSGQLHFLRSLGKFKPLSHEEEFVLARQIREGDKGALDQLVNANLYLVVNMAEWFLNQGLSYLDIIAEGSIGLIRAAKRFDERRDSHFIFCAVRWIRQAIESAIADQMNIVRVPIIQIQQA